MENLAESIRAGERYFGSGGQNSREFHQFFKDFKKSFTYQLKKLKAQEISFSIGHFYLSGFFKVGEQFYYFSLDDVRSSWSMGQWGQPRLLIRTAEHNKDYTGGANHYVAIEKAMYKNIARQFGLKLPDPSIKGKKDITEVVQDIIKKGHLDMYVGSSKKANSIAWRLDDALKPEGSRNTTITGGRYGRTLTYSSCETDEFKYYYDASTKRATYTIFGKELSDDEFLKSLKLDVLANGEVVHNLFVPEQKVFLAPEAVALHDFIKGAELTRHPNFERALSIFRHRYPEAYMELLD